jgi:hypothetical protein
MKLSLKKGTTSKLIQVFIQDSAVTTGAGKTGLSATSASITAYYYREGNSVTTAIPMTNSSLGIFASGGISTVDATNMPGLYQFGIPNTALATGASSVVLMIQGASGAAPILAEIQLVDYNPEDSVRMGLTALPNVVAGASGGVPLGDSSGQVIVSSVTAAGISSIWSKAMSDIATVPSITDSVLAAINWLFILARNKRTQTASQEIVYKDNGTTAAGHSDKSDDGTTFTRGEYNNDIPPPPPP